MRPLEILLVIANLLAFIAVIILGYRKKYYLFSAVSLALVVASIQVIAEGFRCQIVPAYFMTITQGIITVFRMVWYPEKLIRQNFGNRVVMIGSIFLGSFICILSFLLPIILPVFQLKAPLGLYQIGTINYRWIDNSRQEIFSNQFYQPRQLIAQVWYPANNHPSSDRAPYIDDAESMSEGLTHALESGGLLKLPSFFFNHFKYVRTNAVYSSPLFKGTSKVSFPVLIYVSGLDGFRQASMFQIEHLVSNGYVVVGIDQPYTSAAVKLDNGQIVKGWPKIKFQPYLEQSLSPKINTPLINGKPLPRGILPYLAQDISFIINQLEDLNIPTSKGILAGHLDLSHIGIFGISLGAMVAAQACHSDVRLCACLMMDAAMSSEVVKNGLRQPSMLFTRPASDMRLERVRSGGWSEKDIQQTISTMQEVYTKAKPQSSYFVSIKGMFHANFTDAPYWFPFSSRLGITGPINSQRGFDIVNAYSLAFFDWSLKKQQSSIFSGLSKQYPEVKIIVR